MKNKLAMMTAMVAMVAGMTSCCCKPCDQKRAVTPPVRVVPTKGATVRTVPTPKRTVAPAPAPTRTVTPAPVQQPVVRTQTVVKQVPVYVQPVVQMMPVDPHAIINMHKNYNNSGVPYNAENMGGVYGSCIVPAWGPCHHGSRCIQFCR